MKNSKSVFVVCENARIHTLDPGLPEAGSLLCHNGRIIGIYREKHPSLSGFGEPRRIDCRNLHMFPAFTDSHIHLYDLGVQLGTIDVSAARTEQEAVEILKQHAGNVSPGEWIRGSRWGHNLWKPPALPRKESLDNAFPDNPVFLKSKCGHLLWANSAAFEKAGITPETHNPYGGQIDIDPQTGELTGILKEDASDLLLEKIEEPSIERKKDFLRKAASHLHRFGIVNVHASELIDAFKIIQQVQKENYPVRVLAFLPCSRLDHFIASGLQSGFGSDYLRFGGIKVFVDGSLGGRTAWMYEPYDTEPDNLGIQLSTEEDLMDIMHRAGKANISAMTHAIGDRAVDLILKVYRKTGASKSIHNGIMNRIEHFQLLTEQSAGNLSGLNVVASMQPVHLFSDWSAGNQFWGERSRYAYALATMKEAGLPMVLGSDGPVEPVNPLWGMYAAITRQDLDGNPEGGWYPMEKISALDAMKAYTINPAKIAGEDQRKGSLTTGKYADFVLMEKNPLEENPEEWKNSEILATAFEGELVYSKL